MFKIPPIPPGKTPRPSAGPQPLEAKLLAYLEEMERKYDRAASRPWLPVDPDPPEPE